MRGDIVGFEWCFGCDYGVVVKVLESAALGWVRARVIRVKSGGRVVVQSDQGREFTARGNQVRLIEPAGFRP